MGSAKHTNEARNCQEATKNLLIDRKWKEKNPEGKILHDDPKSKCLRSSGTNKATNDNTVKRKYENRQETIRTD
jgi:hypothetical protein